MLGEMYRAGYAGLLGFFGRDRWPIRIHRAECGACKYGTGLYKVKRTEWHQVDYDWEPANTYAEACEIVAALKHSSCLSLTATRNAPSVDASVQFELSQIEFHQ